MSRLDLGSERVLRIGICGSVLFGFASLVGLILGSVSLATVVRAGSTLPSNAVFSCSGRSPVCCDALRSDLRLETAGPR